MQILANRFSEGLLSNGTMQITNICLNQCNIAAYSPMKLKHDVHAEADGNKKSLTFGDLVSRAIYHQSSQTCPLKYATIVESML